MKVIGILKAIARLLQIALLGGLTVAALVVTLPPLLVAMYVYSKYRAVKNLRRGR